MTALFITSFGFKLPSKYNNFSPKSSFTPGITIEMKKARVTQVLKYVSE